MSTVDNICHQSAPRQRQRQDAGIPPRAICAFGQNDAFGMLAVEALRQIWVDIPAMADLISLLDTIATLEGDNPPRNFLGPVGVFQRETLPVRDAVLSLDVWGEDYSTPCQAILVSALSTETAAFTAYSRLKGKSWIVLTGSFTTALGFFDTLKRFNVTEGVVTSQVVPSPSSDLAIVADAREALGSAINLLSIEGFVVGRLALEGLRRAGDDLTPTGFANALLGHAFDIGGLQMDFTDDRHGSSDIFPQILRQGQVLSVTQDQLVDELRVMSLR
ncbi:MAG: hypothetical protein ACFCBW_03725 [Candidatus Competibacterales bacterium]